MMQRCMRGGWGNLIKGLILEHDAHFDPSVGSSTYFFSSFCSFLLQHMFEMLVDISVIASLFPKCSTS